MVDRIARGFAQVDPGHAASYASNADSLKSALTDLDRAFRTGLARCATRDMITSHAAFGYLAATYQLHQVPISGVSPDAEPSPKQLMAITSFARAQHATVIFFESLVSPKLSQTVAAEVGARTLVLDPLEAMTKDDLAAGSTYLSVMRQNLNNLEVALRCTP
jgi:zinc transport system substrate-binding protein